MRAEREQREQWEHSRKKAGTEWEQSGNRLGNGVGTYSIQSVNIVGIERENSRNRVGIDWEQILE